jgi:hypothetical protein
MDTNKHEFFVFIRVHSWLGISVATYELVRAEVFACGRTQGTRSYARIFWI